LTGGSKPNQLLQQAESLLHEEMAALVTNDAFLFPTKGSRPPKEPVALIDYEPSELLAAAELLAQEVSELDAAAGGEAVNSSALLAALEDNIGHIVYSPQARRYVEWRMIGKGERLEAAKHMYDLADFHLQKEAKRAQKLEDKLGKILGGYMHKAKDSISKVGALSEECETITTETDVFRTLRAREAKAIESRIEEVQECVEREKKANALLQARYKDLKLLEKKLDQRLQ